MRYPLPIILFFCSIVYSQNEIGLPLSEIKSKFQDSIYELKQDTEVDGTITISVKLENAYATYYFDNDIYKLSNTLVITPNSQKSLEEYITLYNSKYTMENSTIVKWKAETKLSDELSIIERIYLSKMTTQDNNSFYTLIWTLE
jgi:hypothetical protein